MPSGRRHETLNLLALGGLGLAYYLLRARLAHPWPESLLPLPARLGFIAAYLIGTFLVTPDLDLAKGSVRAKSHWGVLGWLWLPYGALFRHRGVSHGWLLGPLTRLVYLLMLLLALLELASLLAPAVGASFSVEAQLGRGGWPLLGGALAGYYLSQWLHLWADGIPAGKGRAGRR